MIMGHSTYTFFVFTIRGIEHVCCEELRDIFHHNGREGYFLKESLGNLLAPKDSQENDNALGNNSKSDSGSSNVSDGDGSNSISDRYVASKPSIKEQCKSSEVFTVLPGAIVFSLCLFQTSNINEKVPSCTDHLLSNSNHDRHSQLVMEMFQRLKSLKSVSDVCSFISCIDDISQENKKQEMKKIEKIALLDCEFKKNYKKSVSLLECSKNEKFAESQGKAEAENKKNKETENEIDGIEKENESEIDDDVYKPKSYVVRCTRNRWIKPKIILSVDVDKHLGYGVGKYLFGNVYNYDYSTESEEEMEKERKSSIVDPQDIVIQKRKEQMEYKSIDKHGGLIDSTQDHVSHITTANNDSASNHYQNGKASSKKDDGDKSDNGNSNNKIEERSGDEKSNNDKSDNNNNGIVHVPVDPQNPEILFRCFLSVPVLLFGISLLENLEKGRLRQKDCHWSTMLNQTLSYSLGKIANIQIGDVVVDPMCGTGTILLEACHFIQPHAVYFGGDLVKTPVEAAHKNAVYFNNKKVNEGHLTSPMYESKKKQTTDLETNVEVNEQHQCNLDVLVNDLDTATASIKTVVTAATNKFEYLQMPNYFIWNASKVTLRESSIDIFISDLPFGVRHGSWQGILSLYEKLMEMMETSLRPGGRAVLLTICKKSLVSAMEKRLRLQILDVYTCSVANFNGSIFMIKKLEDHQEPVKIQEQSINEEFNVYVKTLLRKKGLKKERRINRENKMKSMKNNSNSSNKNSKNNNLKNNNNKRDGGNNNDNSKGSNKSNDSSNTNYNNVDNVNMNDNNRNDNDDHIDNNNNSNYSNSNSNSDNNNNNRENNGENDDNDVDQDSNINKRRKVED
eukprot:Awhi_evm1s10165